MAQSGGDDESQNVETPSAGGDDCAERATSFHGFDTSIGEDVDSSAADSQSTDSSDSDVASSVSGGFGGSDVSVSSGSMQGRRSVCCNPLYVGGARATSGEEGTESSESESEDGGGGESSA